MIQSYIPTVMIYGLLIMGMLITTYIISKNHMFNTIAEEIINTIERRNGEC